ncbi:MAG: VanZ family protein [Candidatus Altiarchaeota archaeon]|nr:VanZ family protein [Candidatus Altiarchaeota archaeon]
MRVINWLEEHKRACWLLTLGYMSLIFLLSSMPRLPQPLPFTTYSQIIEHVGEYAVLGFLLSMSLRSKREGVKKKTLLFAVLIASLYGVSDEFHQFFVPGRVASVFDVFADVVGSILGVFFRRRLG